MKGINRRRFLQLAGASSIVAATSGVATVVPKLSNRLMANGKDGTITFRAITGLPSKPLPSYASLMVEGHVNLTTRSGVVTKTVFAGSPQARSTVALPGLSRIIRVTDVEDLGSMYRIRGIVDDRSQLQRGESSTFELLLDPMQRIVKTNSFGANVVLRLEE